MLQGVRLTSPSKAGPEAALGIPVKRGAGVSKLHRQHSSQTLADGGGGERHAPHASQTRLEMHLAHAPHSTCRIQGSQKSGHLIKVVMSPMWCHR